MRNHYGTFHLIATAPNGTAEAAYVREPGMPVPSIQVMVLSDPGRRMP